MTDVIDPFDIALGARIRARREELRITQAQLIAWTFRGVSAVTCALQGWLLCRHLRSQSQSHLKRRAIRLHAKNWTHGRIAEELGHEPREVAQWLAEADRARAL